MKLEVKYEWDYEETDEDGDIIDHCFSDKLADMTQQSDSHLTLVRNVGNENEGLVDRSWAYVKDGLLPDYFTDTDNCRVAKVPARFHRELATYLAAAKV